MDLGVFELQIFVSLIVVLGAAFVALVCDYLKGNNEQLREHNIELRVRKDEQEHRGILDPGRWLEQLVGLTQTKAQSAASANEPRSRTKAAESNEAVNSWANRQDLERSAQRGTNTASRRTKEHRPAVEDWVSPETMARVASNLARQSADGLAPDEGPAVAESKGDIRDEIQKLVESSPRPRRGKVYPANGSTTAVGMPASTSVTPETATVQEQPALVSGLAVPEPEPIDATGGGMESIVPPLEMKKELERVANTRHRVSSASPTVTQFPVSQVMPLHLEQELLRVTEAESSYKKTSGAQPVSALLDEVIAASFQRGQRGPEPERQPGQSATPVTSRPLLETKHELTDGGFPIVPEISEPGPGKLQTALQQIDVVVPVHALAQAIYEAERVTPAPLVIPWHVEPLRVEPVHEAPVEPEPNFSRTTEPEAAAAIERQRNIPPFSLETAFSWPPPRSFHASGPDAEPARITAHSPGRYEPPASIEEPRDLTCLEEDSATGIPQAPEPAMFQAMIESISLMPIETVPAYDGPVIAGHYLAADSTQAGLLGPPIAPLAQIGESPAGAGQPDDPSTGVPDESVSDLLLPAGMHNRLVFSRLIEAPGSLSGVVVAISLNDFKKIQESFTHQAFDDLLQSIDKLMNSMIRDLDFAAKLDDNEWIFVFRDEVGAVAQKRILQISEKLWDFQLRALGSVSILFGWGAVEVESERLSESYNAATERMQQSRRGRKTVAMDSRDKRRVANG